MYQSGAEATEQGWVLCVCGRCAWMHACACTCASVCECTQSWAYYEGNSVTSFMPFSLTIATLSVHCTTPGGASHVFEGMNGALWSWGTPWPSPYHVTAGRTHQGSLRVFTAMPQLLWEDLEEMCPKVGTQALGTQQESSLLPQDAKRTLILLLPCGARAKSESLWASYTLIKDLLAS